MHKAHTVHTTNGMHKLPFCVNSMRMLFNHVSDMLRSPHFYAYTMPPRYRLDMDAHIYTLIIICDIVWVCVFSLMPKWQWGLQVHVDGQQRAFQLVLVHSTTHRLILCVAMSVRTSKQIIICLFLITLTSHENFRFIINLMMA